MMATCLFLVLLLACQCSAGVTFRNGRTLTAANGSVTFDMSGTIMRFSINGSQLSIRAAGHSWWRVSVDGATSTDFKMNTDTVAEFEVVGGLAAGPHVVEMTKSTEGGRRACLLALCGGLPASYAPSTDARTRKISLPQH